MATAAKVTGAITRWWWVRHAPVPNPEARCYGQSDKDCDVSNEADGQAVVAKAVSMGKLVGLVNCAGIAPAEKTVGKNAKNRCGDKSYWRSRECRFKRLECVAETEQQ